MRVLILLSAAVLFISDEAWGQEFKCPHEYGFYPHKSSCDKYYKCENSIAQPKTCGNGLAFDTGDSKFLTENCDYLHNVDCGDRTELEPPIKSANCPRLYGIFPDETKCDTFWSCWNGESNKYTCAPGLAYDADARVCMWSDQVPGCNVKDIPGSFQCPDQKNNPNPGTFSRHAHPDDCRKYYVCLDGNPREYGCPVGTVFQIGSDEFSGQCTDPEGVDGCEKYYGDDLKSIKKSELLLGLSGNSDYKHKSTTRKKVPQQAKETISVPVPAKVSNSREQQTVRARPANVNPRPVNTPQRVAPPVTTQRPVAVTTTTTAKTADDDYYYYEDEVKAGSQTQ